MAALSPATVLYLAIQNVHWPLMALEEFLSADLSPNKTCSKSETDRDPRVLPGPRR